MRRYTFEDIRGRKLPRLIVSMKIYDGNFECGYNRHYALDEEIISCLLDFFSGMKEEYPDFHIDPKRSKLDFRYVDLPEMSNNT